jgi:hypothetical protein
LVGRMEENACVVGWRMISRETGWKRMRVRHGMEDDQLEGRMKNNALKEGWKKIRWEVKWRKKRKVVGEKEDE